MPRQGGKRGRKAGRKARQEAFKRYWSKQKGFANRREMHKERNVLRHEMMVEESRERRAAQRAGRRARKWDDSGNVPLY